MLDYVSLTRIIGARQRNTALLKRTENMTSKQLKMNHLNAAVSEYKKAPTEANKANVIRLMKQYGIKRLEA